MAAASDVTRCDFCLVGDPEEVYVLVSVPMQIGNAISTGEWATCRACLDFLVAENWDALYQRWLNETGNLLINSRPVQEREAFQSSVRRNILLLWKRVWNKRMDIREATDKDKIKMIRGLKDFRDNNPDRLVP